MFTNDPRLTHPSLRPIFETAEQRWLERWRVGPSRRTWTSMPLQVGDEAPDLTLRDETGEAVRLSTFWAQGPALLLFWRHWGCECGLDRLTRLREEHAALVDAGANVVIVGQGEPERAAWYAEAFDPPCPVICDQDGSAYCAYGLLEMSPWLLLGKPKPQIAYFENQIEEYRGKGHPVADNPFLLPGEFIVDRQGRLVLTYRYQFCDNFPDRWTLVDSIREAIEGG